MPRHFLLLACLLSALCLPAPADPASSPTPPPLDLIPLKKALTPLDGTGAIQSHTTLRMTGTRAGVSVTLREDLQIVSHYPNRFRASLSQYDTQGGPQKKLVVVSNGVLVWTYRPGLRQYSVMSLAAFKKADSSIPTLGLIIGGFYLGDGRPLVQGFHSITPTNSADVLASLSGMNVSLSRQTKSVGNQDDYVYSLALSQQNLTYQFFANSQTDMLARVELSGTERGTEVLYREDVSQITPSLAVPQSTFVFTPPLGATKIPAVSINPF